MQFEEGAQLALGLVQLAARAAAAASSTRRRSAGARSGSRSVCTCFGDDEALALERTDGLVGERQRLGQVGGRERALFEHGEDAARRDRRARHRAATGARRRGRNR